LKLSEITSRVTGITAGPVCISWEPVEIEVARRIIGFLEDLTAESIAPQASATRIAKGELTKQHVLNLCGPTRAPTVIRNDEPYVQSLASR